MDNTSPVQGDERWYPVYWSTKKNPTTEQQNTTWRIGSGKGIKDGASYNIYIFLKKQVYNGKEWEDATPQDIKYITGSNGKALTFTAASISDKEWNAYIAELSGTPIPGNDGDNGGNGGSGDDADGLVGQAGDAVKGKGQHLFQGILVLHGKAFSTLIFHGSSTVTDHGYNTSKE